MWRNADRRTDEGRLRNMNSRAGRSALVVVGVIALLVGGVFALQGANVLPGSFMTGSRTWLGIGLVVVVVGIVLLVFGLRRPRDGSAK